MAQNAGQTKTTLDGLMKDVYSDEKLESLLPDYAVLKKEIKFDAANKIGRDFVKAVSLTREHGFSYGESLTTALEGIISANVDDAKVRGSQMTLRAGWTYAAAHAMASNKAAFIDQTAHKFMCMMESAAFRLEAQMIHGSKGFLVTDASNAGDAITAVVNTSQVKVAIDPLFCSDALIAGLENANISFFAASDNSTGIGVTPDGGVLNKFAVVSVDLDNKAVVVECGNGTQAGNLVTALEAAAYNVYFYGAKANEMVGLRSIVSNTGLLYGISAASYSAWAGNSATVTGNLNLKVVLKGVGKAVGRGLAEKAMVLVNPQTFATMANDEAALRQYTAKTSVGDRGVSKIEYVGSNGPIEIVSHPLVWESQAIAFPSAKASRIGSTDLTFSRPGSDGEMLFDMQSYGGIEARLFCDQALFLPSPAHCVLFNSVSNS
jgi:hypothetical protein